MTLTVEVNKMKNIIKIENQFYNLDRVDFIEDLGFNINLHYGNVIHHIEGNSVEYLRNILTSLHVLNVEEINQKLKEIKK